MSQQRDARGRFVKAEPVEIVNHILGKLEPFWLPWKRCQYKGSPGRCQLTRLHVGEHARQEGFDLHWFS